MCTCDGGGPREDKFMVVWECWVEKKLSEDVVEGQELEKG